MKLFIGVVLAVLSTAYAQEVTICQGVPHNSFVPNLGQCNAWFRCTPNGPVPGTCPDPWLFNAGTQECDWEWNVSCFQCPITVPFIDIAVNGSCTQFVRCINGRATHLVCQSGLHFNPTTQRCDPPELTACAVPEMTCPPNIPPGTMVTFRSATNCSVFFVCTGQVNPERRECNSQLHFDTTIQQCTHPNMTDCPLPPPGDGTPTPDPEDPGNGNPPTTNPPFSCPSDGHHRHPTTCSSFIVCASGTPHFFTCSDGLHFNVRTNQCDLPANAQCTV